MKQPSNLPPGITDRMIEEQQAPAPEQQQYAMTPHARALELADDRRASYIDVRGSCGEDAGKWRDEVVVFLRSLSAPPTSAVGDYDMERAKDFIVALRTCATAWEADDFERQMENLMGCFQVQAEALEQAQVVKALGGTSLIEHLQSSDFPETARELGVLFDMLAALTGRK